MKLKEFNFKRLSECLDELKSIGLSRIVTLSVRMENGPWYEGISIGETLKSLPSSFADAEIKNTRWYFNELVIELKEKN